MALGSKHGKVDQEAVSKITFNNIEMDKVRNPIIINQYYCLKDHCPNQTAALMIYDVSYTNIHGTYNVKNPPVHLACSDSVPCTNITLSQVQLHPAAAQGDGELDLDPPFCWKAYGIIETHVTPPLRSYLMGELPKNKFVLQQDSNNRC